MPYKQYDPHTKTYTQPDLDEPQDNNIRLEESYFSNVAPAEDDPGHRPQDFYNPGQVKRIESYEDYTRQIKANNEPYYQNPSKTSLEDKKLPEKVKKIK